MTSLPYDLLMRHPFSICLSLIHELIPILLEFSLLRNACWLSQRELSVASNLSMGWSIQSWLLDKIVYLSRLFFLAGFCRALILAWLESLFGGVLLCLILGADWADELVAFKVGDLGLKDNEKEIVRCRDPRTRSDTILHTCRSLSFRRFHQQFCRDNTVLSALTDQKWYYWAEQYC